MLEHGFMSAWTNLVDSLDPFGEKNSLKVLGLGAGATQDEIKSKYVYIITFHNQKNIFVDKN